MQPPLSRNVMLTFLLLLLQIVDAVHDRGGVHLYAALGHGQTRRPCTFEGRRSLLRRYLLLPLLLPRQLSHPTRAHHLRSPTRLRPFLREGGSQRSAPRKFRRCRDPRRERYIDYPFADERYKHGVSALCDGGRDQEERMNDGGMGPYSNKNGKRQRNRRGLYLIYPLNDIYIISRES